ncbi:MAG TPA: sodium:solute symporter [Gemmatimonadaceae bacterium]|nr:sodium:solute symporter [Gemmatimonadaceae bacterium]
MSGSGVTLLDGIVVIAYLIGTTLLGVRLGRGQQSARDYFVSNDTVPWWAVLFSVVATETSALTFISIPGLAYIGNLGFLQVALGYLIGRVIISFVLLPRYFDGELVTAYALLERRFGTGTRRFASLVFMVTRIFGDSVRLFATAIPVALLIGPIVPAEYVGPASILILGACTVVYTYHGGMKAVIWTDVIQIGVYLLGGIGALWIIGGDVMGGWSRIFAEAGPRGQLQLFDLYTGFDRPHTLWAGLLGGGFLSMASHGVDQMIVQRLFATGSVQLARRALIGSGIVVLAQFALFLIIGVGLFAFYGGETFPRPDAIFPRFIVEAMPPGLTGVVIAAVLAAAMSTISSSINSLAAATVHDLYLPMLGRTPDDATLLRTSKRLTLVWAVVLIGGALLYRDEGTPVVTIALSIASFTYGGLLGAFFLGLLVRGARQRDAMLGMAVGISVMSVVVFANQLSTWFPSLAPTLAPVRGVAWPWFVLIGTSLTFATGLLASRFPPASPAPVPVPESAA